MKYEDIVQYIGEQSDLLIDSYFKNILSRKDITVEDSLMVKIHCAIMADFIIHIMGGIDNYYKNKYGDNIKKSLNKDFMIDLIKKFLSNDTIYLENIYLDETNH